MVTEHQLEVIRRKAIEEVCRLSGEPTTPYERGAVSRLMAYGLRILQATQSDSWEIAALEANDE